MSFVELKAKVTELSREENLDLAALLLHLRRKDDPAYRAELDRRLMEMDSSPKISQAEVLRLHQELLAQGR